MGETLKYALKISVLVGLALTLFNGVYALIALITLGILPSAFGEVIKLVNVYLPFNANSFFVFFSTAISGILAFMIARKTYDILSGVQRDAS